jgi:hypothetical protein
MQMLKQERYAENESNLDADVVAKHKEYGSARRAR